MDTTLAVIAALASAGASVAAVFAAVWARRASIATAETARKAEWGLNFRAACDRLASDSEKIKQLGVDQLLAMRSDGTLDDDQKRQLVGVAKHLLREHL